MFAGSRNDRVLLPYKITLLSNILLTLAKKIAVLLPYKITLLSNPCIACLKVVAVLLPYKITLLSNLKFKIMTLLISAFYIRQ